MNTRGAFLATGATFVVRLLFTASPVLAAPPQSGTQLFTASQCEAGATTDGVTCTSTMTFPADTPFYVQHGFGQTPWRTASSAVKTDFNNPGTNFTLSVDGARMKSIPYRTYDQSTDFMFKLFLTNFPAGMTGMHTFVGQFFDHSAGLELACVVTVSFS